MLELSMDKKGKQAHFSTISDVLENYEKKEDKYISREFQKYGYDLAEQLNDLKNKSLYIKLAKKEDRALLESVKSFVIDAENVKNPTALFLWKLTELKKKRKQKEQKNK
ncbi:hypothetical protein JXA63_01605 [Candidatus Woesebacteria bacterium]|nr:hypothetical protein [Candidatus Woesebacteria bacterium]